MAYSFGSIVAIDALFPTTDDPPLALDRVAGLATIGSPFDFVHSIRRTWETGRHIRKDVPPYWLNVYSPDDLLGSNFRGDPNPGEATKGIVPIGAEADPDTKVKGPIFRPKDNLAWDLGIEMTFGNLIELYGFTSHGMYWGDDDTSDANVFDLVVRNLYKGAPVLA
jgi:hypothetical protein